ncbi:UNVERIFIED_CONTAM: hypothetical protein Scaly_2210400 [Sesamum calycinum]|uniref:Transposase-associated domain-containing protein n=1 Tax=Sesamum calycinum TaxID=2727403 RepID=A0AAW2MNR8_9LAMI
MHNKNLLKRACLTPEFEDGVKIKEQRRNMNRDKLRCTCRKCKNTKFGTPDEVRYHLCMRGFMAENYNWTSQGEDIVQDYYEASSVPQVSEESTSTGHVEGVPDDGTRSCPVDAGTSSYVYDGGGPYDYYESRILPSDHTLLGDYYSTTNLVKDLGLPVEKIHACKNGCMLYWKDDVDLEYCKFCGDGRYKLAKGQDPHRKKSPYVVLSTPYNLPPDMCMSSEYMFLTIVIPSSSNPKRLIDVYLESLIEELLQLWHVINVYLESLIEELLQLWHVGVRTYDHATDRAFMMRATLM